LFRLSSTRLPRPGRSKIRSVKIAPARLPAMSRPKIVITGINPRPQRVFVGDHPVRQALGPGGPDVVLAEGLYIDPREYRAYWVQL